MEKLNGKFKGLRKAEEKHFLIRVSKYLAKRIAYLNNVEGWTDTEISKHTGVPQNRLSEIKNVEKYNRPVQKKHLALLIEGEIVTVTDLKQNIPMNEKETELLDTFKIHEDELLKKEYRALKDAGFNPAKILADFRKNNLK